MHNTDLPQPEKEKEQRGLWTLTLSPAIWVLHFLGSYLTAAIWCERIWCERYTDPGGAFTRPRMAIIVYTIFAFVGIGFVGWRSWKPLRDQDASPPFDGVTPESSQAFLNFATVLLSGLSAVATLFVATVIVFMETCD